MSKTPKTDKLIESFRVLCKKAGYNVKSAKQLSIEKAARLVRNAQARLVANELKKTAEIRKQLKKAKAEKQA